MININTPGDLLLLNSILCGQQQTCSEWERVERVPGIGGYERPICPVGCVRTAEDVERKCGLRYHCDSLLLDQDS